MRVPAAVVVVSFLVGFTASCSAEARPAAGETRIEVPHYPDEGIEGAVSNWETGRLTLGEVDGKRCLWLASLDGSSRTHAALLWAQDVDVFASAKGVRIVEGGRTILRPGERFAFSGGESNTPLRTDDPCVVGLVQVRVDAKN